MENIKIDFSKSCGKVKPMHAVNNGSEYKFLPDQRISNIDAFRDAQIPYARTHDASFYATHTAVSTRSMYTRFLPISEKTCTTPIHTILRGQTSICGL